MSYTVMLGKFQVSCDTPEEAVALVDHLHGMFAAVPDDPGPQPGGGPDGSQDTGPPETMETTRRYGCPRCGATRDVTAVPSRHVKVLLCQGCGAEMRQVQLSS
jgi:hypothetical protein